MRNCRVGCEGSLVPRRGSHRPHLPAATQLGRTAYSPRLGEKKKKKGIQQFWWVRPPRRTAESALPRHCDSSRRASRGFHCAASHILCDSTLNRTAKKPPAVVLQGSAYPSVIGAAEGCPRWSVRRRLTPTESTSNWPATTRDSEDPLPPRALLLG